MSVTMRSWQIDTQSTKRGPWSTWHNHNSTPTLMPQWWNSNNNAIMKMLRQRWQHHKNDDLTIMPQQKMQQHTSMMMHQNQSHSNDSTQTMPRHWCHNAYITNPDDPIQVIQQCQCHKTPIIIQLPSATLTVDLIKVLLLNLKIGSVKEQHSLLITYKNM